ncbi:MAG: ATP-binding protein [Candidatus Cloacimonetes bacterium]|nr:ATP-binding protein [Candidatus Cloacimonadota bacterium]
MRLKISNIGIVKQADIEINGITVIAGENDTGKSTIGKILYSITKVVNNYKKHFSKYQYSVIVDYIYIIAESTLNSGKYFIEFGNDVQEYLSQADSKKEKKTFNELLHKYRPKKNQFWEDNNEEIEKYFKEIEKVLQLEKDSFLVRKTALDRIFKNEFEGQVCNLFSSELSEIKLNSGEKKIFNVNIINNEIKDIITFEKMTSNDVTYIESPFIFSFLNTRKTRHIVGSEDSSNISHIDDLKKKINKFINGNFNINLVEEILYNDKIKRFEDIISKNIGGKINYNKDLNSLIFSKNDKSIKMNNTATGIRAFALIDLILKIGALKSNEILIIDEPEVHLHPVWQVEYAELLVLMAKELSVKILITTHSSYFIEAIRLYSEKHLIKKKTNFYLSEMAGDSSVITNVNDRLDLIYEKLNKSYKKLDGVLGEIFSKRV